MAKEQPHRVRVTRTRSIARVFGVLVVVVAAVAIGGLTLTRQAGAQEQSQPHIVLINLDDASWDLLDDQALEHLPNIRQYFRDEGLRFTNLHVADPLCGPSRASLFRGQYPHNTEVLENALGWEVFYDNGYTDDEVGMWMRNAGYETTLVGKYCHEEYPAASNDNAYVPPGWDRFHASLGVRYYESQLNIDGVRRISAPYPDDYLTDTQAIDLVDIVGQIDQPSFVYWAPIGPHAATPGSGGMVPQRYEEHFADLQAPRTPSFNEADLTDKSRQFQSIPIADADQIELWDEQYRDRMRAMLAIDDAIGELMSSIESAGIDDNTYVLLTSDNGFHLGQHRLTAKKDHFDEVTRVPLFVRGPGVEAGDANHLLSHIDLIPTVLELGGAALPHVLDGRSFVDLIDDPSAVEAPQWQQSVLVENFEGKTLEDVELDLDYDALRRYDDVFVRFENGDREYYDLAEDPYQLDNAVDSLDQTELADLEAQLDRLVSCQGAQCQDPDAAGYDPVQSTLEIVDDSASGQLRIAGTATDDQAVNSVELVVREVATRRYWDGSDFVDGYVAIEVAAEEATAEMSWELEVPTEPAREYWASARAIDGDGNRQVTLETTFTNPLVDTTAPIVTIDEPERALNNSVGLSGSVTDIDLLNVEVVVQDQLNNLYWNGTNFVEDFVRVPATITEVDEGEWRWDLELDLPDSLYYLAPWALDGAQNLSVGPPPFRNIDTTIELRDDGLAEVTVESGSLGWLAIGAGLTVGLGALVVHRGRREEAA